MSTYLVAYPIDGANNNEVPLLREKLQMQLSLTHYIKLIIPNKALNPLLQE
jgi:hypothetical protein